MGATESKPVLTFTSASPEKVEGGPDYSMMSLCQKDVKKFEYMLFIGAELSRLVYSDVGIIHNSLKALGLSPDILNKVITHYDWKFLSKRRNIAARVSGNFAPPESYELQACSDGIDHSGQPILIRYISSPTDTTCMVVSPQAIQKNANSIINDNDSIVVFKGSSSLRNWEKNFRSVAPGDFAAAIAPVSTGAPSGIMTATSFVVPIVEIFNDIVEAIEKVSPSATRIFVFGHSKGGAEAELGGAMLALKFPEKEIHIISYGSPKVIYPNSKDPFDKFFFIDKKGKFTLTRVESVGTLLGDSVTDIPPGVMVHPGWGTKTDTLDSLRAQNGIKPDGSNKRNDATWPFNEPMNLGDIANKLKLDAEVAKVIGEKPGEAPTVPNPSQGGANYLRVKGSNWAPNPHMEYFGMFFLGSQRLAGMGNPAKTSNTGTREAREGSNENKTFVANIFKDCTKYHYVPWQSRGSILDFAGDAQRIGEHAVKQVESKVGDLRKQYLPGTARGSSRHRTPRKRKLRRTIRK
jgi:hypothetical protein